MNDQSQETKILKIQQKSFGKYGFQVFFPHTTPIGEALQLATTLLRPHQNCTWLMGYSTTKEGIYWYVYCKEEIVLAVKEIVEKYYLQAECLDNIFTVGVGGDERTYAPAFVLVGPFPGYDVLAKVSSEISNKLPVNRVTFQLEKPGA